MMSGSLAVVDSCDRVRSGVGCLAVTDSCDSLETFEATSSVAERRK